MWSGEVAERWICFIAVRENSGPKCGPKPVRGGASSMARMLPPCVFENRVTLLQTGAAGRENVLHCGPEKCPAALGKWNEPRRAGMHRLIAFGRTEAFLRAATFSERGRCDYGRREPAACAKVNRAAGSRGASCQRQKHAAAAKAQALHVQATKHGNATLVRAEGSRSYTG